MDYHLKLVHTLPEGDTEESVIGEHFIDAGLIEVKKTPGAEEGHIGELDVTLVGEPHVIMDWLINHWNGPGEDYPVSTPARFQFVLGSLKAAKPGRG